MAKVEAMNYAVEQRLRLIEFLLAHYGSVGRVELQDFFGISPAAATRDFAMYLKMHPGNAILNQTSKRYVRSDTFKQVLTGDISHEDRTRLFSQSQVQAHVTKVASHPAIANMRLGDL